MSLLGFECTVNPENLIKTVGAIFEKIKNFHFPKNGFNDFRQIFGFIVHSNLNNMALSAFP